MNLRNRSQLESQFARQFARVSARHRRELIQHLGDPPDAGNIPQAFWDKVQRESEEELALMLLIIFAASAEQHGLPREAAQDHAARFAVTRSRELTSSYVEHSRDMVGQFDGSQKIVRPSRPAVLPPTPRADVVVSRPENTIGYTEYQSKTLGVFGPKRVEGIVVSETTDATTAGSEFAVSETVGLSEDDLWITEDDGKVCLICSPLHKKPRSVWSRFFPKGPKAHVRCRCELEYANVGAAVLVGV